MDSFRDTTTNNEVLNANLKKQLISAQSHLQRIEDKKRDIDERQVKQFSFAKNTES